ncbi:MAG: ferrochelatase [Thermodesulfobacteriota bacterium]|nr:MAG: ferrochelatase [Thermodesulfobacteriota bacterium]
MSKDEKTGLLFLAFGGADSIENIEPFLRNILKGRHLSPEFIERTKERYKLIGGKSPLLDITKAQARGVEEILNRDGERYKSYVGMLNWEPYIKDTLARMRADGIEKSAGFIMAPFTSPVSTGAYDKILEETRKTQGGLPKIKMITNWHINPGFIDIIIENIETALGAFEKREDALVIFSNHSLPREALEGDAYEMKINQTVDEIIRRENYDYSVAYQSQGASHITWLGPRTEDVIEEAKKAGKKGVVIVPLCFAADHVETLYDIDILYKSTAERLGLKFARSASLNDSPKFLEFLAGLVKKIGEIY